MTDIVEIVIEEIVVIGAGTGVEAEVVEINVSPTLEIVEVAEQGPRGPKGNTGEKGDPGSYDGLVAEVAPDPLLLFENALI